MRPFMVRGIGPEEGGKTGPFLKKRKKNETSYTEGKGDNDPVLEAWGNVCEGASVALL